MLELSRPINCPMSHISYILSNSHCANERSEWQTVFSETIDFFKNLHFRCCKLTVISGKLKNSWQSSIMDWDVVWKTLNKDLLTVKSREFPSVLLIGQASRPYSKQWIHFDLIRVMVTSSDVDLPTLPYIALNARKNTYIHMC